MLLCSSMRQKERIHFGDGTCEMRVFLAILDWVSWRQMSLKQCSCLTYMYLARTTPSAVAATLITCIVNVTFNTCSSSVDNMQ